MAGYRFSDSVSSIRFSPATKYFGKESDDLVDFSLGEPRDRPPKPVTDAYRRSLAEGRNRYAPVQGFPALREMVARKLKERNGIEALPSGVMITSGASEGLAFSVFSFVERGDEVIVMEPGYPIAAPLVAFCGGRPMSLLLTKEPGFLLNTDRLSEMITERTKMILINTPHNPTATVLDKRCLKAISEIFDGIIVADEVYENFTYGHRHHSIASVSERPENVITINSFSKTYCMCGYRIGYVHAGEDIIRQMVKLKLCMNTCTGNPVQAAAMAALEDREFPAMMRKRFEERMQVMTWGLRSLGVPFVEPKGAFNVFPDIAELGSDEEAFAFFLKAGVLTMPGSVFHESATNHVRFSFVAGTDRIKEGIARLEDILA